MRNEQEVARLEGELNARRWMARHASDYEPNQTNGQLMENWLRDNGPVVDGEKQPLPLTEENLERAFIGLRRQGMTFISKPVEQTPTLDSVAPTKSYWPPLSSRADVQRLTPEQARKLATGPDREAYQKRLDAIRDGYTNPNPTPSTPATNATDALDSLGLPVVEGADASQLPNCIADVKRMPRSSFNLMYHSKRFGAQFRKRIEHIYAKERAS